MVRALGLRVSTLRLLYGLGFRGKGGGKRVYRFRAQGSGSSPHEFKVRLGRSLLARYTGTLPP
jgi:hypothetical protein